MKDLLHYSALVERPVACAGKGQYFAIVHYGSKGGELYEKTLVYSTRDPRQKREQEVLQDITRMIPARHRPFIVAISVVKRCLHPKSAEVRKIDRTPHYERVFTWVVEHAQSVRSPLHGSVPTVQLPYTNHELRELPVTQIVTTPYWRDASATIGIRGVERTVPFYAILSPLAP